MKPSFIIFVVVLIFIVLDLIEALPSPQGKGGAGKGNASPPPATKGGAGKGTAASAKNNNAGKVTAASANNNNGKGAAATAQTNNTAKGATSSIASAKNNNNGKGANNGADTNAGNANASPPPPGASDQICNGDGLKPGDGTQQKQINTCMRTAMGELPLFNKMVSSLIIAPSNGQTIKANTPFTLQVKLINMITGNFADANKQYYIFSQQLDKKTGFILGHCHLTVQKLNGDTPPDPTQFLFFKGLNDPAVAGVLSAAVVQNNTAKTPGLPAGQYRVCSMAGSFAHQPVLMPVAQRGAQDDCIRFNVQ